MAFSGDAIGFYLQLEDQLTPTLKDAGTAYTKFVKMLEESNATAFKSAKKGLSALAALAESFENLPKTAGKAYDAAISQIHSKAKPIKQTMDLEFSSKSKKKFTESIASAVGKALSGVKIRLSASIPAVRNKYFDTSVALRSAYKQVIQPPDMAGGFENLPKFNKGGKVTVGKGGNVDDVLALLSKGEMVLPADVTKAVEEMTARSRTKSGKFAQMPQGLKDALTTAKALSDMLDVLKDRVDAGLDPKAPEQFAKALKAGDNVMKQLQESAKGVDPKFLDKAGPKLKAFNDKLKELKDIVPKVSGPVEKLFSKILSPVRFLALRAALKDITEALSGVKDKGSEVFNELGAGAEPIESVYKNFGQMNQKLGLSRDELSAFRQESMKVSAAYGDWASAPWSPEEFSESLEGLVNAGMRNKDAMLKLAPAITATVKATGANFDELGESAYKLQDAYGFSEDQIASTFATMAQFGKEANVNSQDLMNQMKDNLSTMGPFLDNLTSPEARKDSINNLARLTASLQSTWGDSAGNMSKSIAEALGQGAGSDAFNKIATLTGASMEQLQKAVTSGDFNGLLNQMAANFNNLSPEALAASKALVGFEGTDSEFQKLVSSTQATKETMEKLKGSVVSNADGMGVLKERAEANQTVFEKLKNGLSSFIQTVPGMGVAIDFFKEFNPTVVLSTLQLGKMAFEFAGPLLSGVGSFAKFATSQLIPSVISIASSAWKAVAALGAKALAWFGVGTAATVAGTAQTVAGTAGAAGGAAAAGGLTAMAAGLVALTPAIPVLAVLAAGAIAVGFAIWLAEGAISAFMQAVVGVAKVVGETLAVLFKSDAGNVAAMGLAMVPFGLGLASLGTGLAAFGLAALAAAPGLIAFSATMRLFGPLKGGGIGAVIMSLVNSFKVDSGALSNVLSSMKNAVSFMVEFAKLAVMVAGLSVGATISSAVDSVLSFFGIGSPMEKLSQQGDAVSKTIFDLMRSFATLAETKTMAVADQIMAALDHSAKFVDRLGPLITSMQNLGNMAGGLDDGMFTNGPLTKLAENKAKFVTALQTVMLEAQGLVQVTNAPVSPQQIDTVSKPSTVIVDNKEEVASQNYTNLLLEQLIGIVSANGGSVTQVIAAPKGRKPSGLAGDIARGVY